MCQLAVLEKPHSIIRQRSATNKYINSQAQDSIWNQVHFLRSIFDM